MTGGVRNNLNGGLGELQPAWQGQAADAFYDKIGTTWTLGIEADAQAAKLIGIALSKVADGSKRACDQILELIEKLVNKLIEAAAMLPIPVVGWGRAVKLVYDGIQIYNAIMNLIQGIQQNHRRRPAGHRGHQAGRHRTVQDRRHQPQRRHQRRQRSRPGRVPGARRRQGRLRRRHPGVERGK